MNQEQRAQIAEKWFGLAQMYGRELNRTALTIMLDAVADLPAAEIEAALNKWAMTSKQNRHPLPAEIRDIIQPEADPRSVAIATVGRIKEAIALYGWPKPDAARMHIGEDGWRYIERSGGWQAVCEKPELNIHEPNVHAQMRDAIEADVKLVRAGFDMSKPLLEQSVEKSKGLESAGNIVSRLLPKREDPT